MRLARPSPTLPNTAITGAHSSPGNPATESRQGHPIAAPRDQTAPWKENAPRLAPSAGSAGVRLVRAPELDPWRIAVWAPRAREAPHPPEPVPRYLAAVQLSQLLHDPLLQHQPLPELLAIVFHCHFSLLMAPLLLLLLLHRPGGSSRGHGRRVLPGGARASARARAAARAAPGALEEHPRAAAAGPTGRLAAARRHRHVPARGSPSAARRRGGGARAAPLAPRPAQRHARDSPAPAPRAARAPPPGSCGDPRSRGDREEAGRGPPP